MTTRRTKAGASLPASKRQHDDIEAEGATRQPLAIAGTRRPSRQRGEKVTQPDGPGKTLDPKLMESVAMADGSKGWCSRLIAHLLDRRHDNALRSIRKALDECGDALTHEEIPYDDEYERKQPEVIMTTAAWAQVLGAMRSPMAGNVIVALALADEREKASARMVEAAETVRRQLAAERKTDEHWVGLRRAVATAEKLFQDALKEWQGRNPDAARPHDFVNSARLHSIVVTGTATPLFDRETAAPDALVLMLEVLRVDIALLRHDCGYAARKPRLLEVAAKERQRLTPAPSVLAIAGAGAVMRLEGSVH